MPDLTSSLSVLLGFVLSLLSLAWLSRQISIHIQLPIYHLTRSEDVMTVTLFLVFLPGVLLHEGAHWFTARLLGLRTSKFRVWPKRQGGSIGLGSVSVQSRGPAADSLVGLAPLIAGSGCIAWIGHYIFNAHHLTDRLAQGYWLDGLYLFRHALAEPDGVLWAYLLFAVANAMMPSSSDRQPMKPVLLYATLASAFYLFLGLSLNPVAALMEWLTPTLQNLSSAFLFTIVLDGIVLAVLYLIRLLIGT